MYCVNCGAPLKEGARFCSRCGTPAMKQGPADRRTLFPPLVAALLALLVLGASLLAFRLASIPRQDTPSGTLATLVNAFARRDRNAAANCVDPEGGRDLVLDWMEDADGAAQLLYRLASTHDDGSNDAADVARLLDGFSKLELVTTVYDWNATYSNAQSLSALLRVTTRDGGSYTLSLTNLDFTCRYGNWYLK